MEPKIFKYLKNDKTVLEGSPLEKLASSNQLMAYLQSFGIVWIHLGTKII